ncbi:MAG: hypothetical protein R2860_01335 [Desulfobacterales bacterium]
MRRFRRVGHCADRSHLTEVDMQIPLFLFYNKENAMFQKCRFVILLLCLFMLAVAGCNDSSSKKKPTVDASYKGYPNGGLTAVADDLSELGKSPDARSADAL